MRFKLSLRSKIAISFAGVILASGLLTTLTGIQLLGSGTIREAQNRVKLDLNAAREIYNEKLKYVETVLKFTALRSKLKEMLHHQDRKNMGLLLDEVRKESGLDILNITDPKGTVVLRSRNLSSWGDNQYDNPLVHAVINWRKPVSATELITKDVLAKEGADLAERARIDLVATAKAKPLEKAEETRGMMLLAAVPMIEGDQIVGVLYGGTLINKNYELVDKIKDIVFRNQKYVSLRDKLKGFFYKSHKSLEKDLGSATIFLRDIRVSTNVLGENGERAIGTRVSEAVGKQVLENSHEWVDEAFVVKEWYITAYEPIKNYAGDTIGMLYVGLLKKPFSDTRLRVVAIFLAIAVGGVFIVFLVSNFVAGRISMPLRHMRDVAKQIAAGDYSRGIRVRSSDVVGELAEAFNTMTKKLIGVQEELQQWVKTLEDRVEERTKQIKEIQKELIQIEKMASVGRLAAGVAHEINNPLTGILTNASLLMEEFPQDSTKYDDLKTIVNETIRCRKIVKDLLDFSRQTQPERKPLDINQIINTTCELVWNQVSFKNVIVKSDLAKDLPKLMIDRDQITQVCMNILLNAADAMPNGGDISITSKISPDQKNVEIYFKDSGMGIAPEDLNHIFDPFFTTKPHGTGLGLAITYGIIQQHSGSISVESEKGKGTTFIVRLPVPSKGN
jgi:two-component system, NtrC family, sensor kinase